MGPLIRVLYVDDDPDLRAMAELALAAVGGLAVTLCADGSQAVALACSSDAQLVLLDVVMPGLDGPATLAALRADPATAALPVLFVTALDGDDDRARLLALGAAGIIAKPLDLMGLAGQVKAAWMGLSLTPTYDHGIMPTGNG
ncbi:response regulator [Niveispirillum sp. KHB5.9]|uniref:response regulator n=1 Tax=Niveispirillum sp. KHB5.9 TaxID=3400269 RepID=UPI003A8BC9C9